MGIWSKLFGKKSKPQQDAIRLISLSAEDFIKDKDSRRVWTLTTAANMNTTQHLYDDAKKMLQAAMMLSYESESLGPDHEVTIFTQSALSNAFFRVGESAGALENGREAFQKCHIRFGARHEYTTQLAWNTFNIMMATTGDFAECLKFEQAHLNWLFHTNPGELSEIQRDVREALAEIVGHELEQEVDIDTSEPKRDISIIPETASDPGEQDFSNPAFTLGVHIEEFYCLIGEQMQVRLGDEGFDDLAIDVQERKMGITKDILIDLEVDDDTIMSLFQIEDSLKRTVTDQSSAGKKAFIEESSKIANEIDELMEGIRPQLDDTTGLQYDLGIFIARIGFCARYILFISEVYPEPYKAQYKEIYTKELIRAGTKLAEILARAGDNFLNSVFEAIYVDQFITLAKMLVDKTKLKRSKVEEINQIIEEMLALQRLM